MNTIHHHPQESIEFLNRISFRNLYFIRNPSSGLGSMPKISPVALVVTQRKSKFPCKISPKVKWIIGTVRLHEYFVFSGLIIFSQREIIVQEILIPVLSNFVQSCPRRTLIGILKQGIDPGRIEGFRLAVPSPLSIPCLLYTSDAADE